MNGLSTFSFLKSINSIENNSLEGKDLSASLSGGALSTEFASTLQTMLSASGKLKPLDLNLADIASLDLAEFNDLLELQGIQLPADVLSDLSKLAHNLTLNHAPVTVAQFFKHAELLSEKHNTANTLAGLNNDKSVGQDLLGLQQGKASFIDKNVVTDINQAVIPNKAADKADVLNITKFDLSESIKNFLGVDKELKTDFVNQLARPDVNTVKLVDQLASVDKTASVINPINTQAVQTVAHEQPMTLLRRIEIPVNQPGWSEAVGNRLMMMVNDKMQSAHIHLNPPELGPIEVRVNMNRDQATVHFVSGHTAVRDAIEEAFPRLRELFAQNGLSLADANVSQQSPRQQHGYSNNDTQNLNTGITESLDTDETPIQKPLKTTMLDVGLVDHYV